MAEPTAESDPLGALLEQLPRARSDLVVFGLAGALALAGLAGPAVWRALDPELSASVAFHAGERDDSRQHLRLSVCFQVGQARSRCVVVARR